MHRAAVLLVAAVAMLWGSFAHAKMVITSDNGGLISDYAARFISARESGEEVVIDGSCLAACTLAVGMVPQVCVTPKAVLGFQAAWRPMEGGKKVYSDVASKSIMEVYPAQLRKWITERGGLSPKMLYLKGRELAEIVPRCGSAEAARLVADQKSIAQERARQKAAAVETRPGAPPAPPATVARPPDAAPRPTTTEHRVALVIGNDSYPNSC
jgi:hypothetical protein